jgi:hypothetical protein
MFETDRSRFRSFIVQVLHCNKYDSSTVANIPPCIISRIDKSSLQSEQQTATFRPSPITLQHTMSTGAITIEDLHYRCIDTDYGGTYSNGDFASGIFRAIGTQGCHSCVGVYMKLSSTTCFVAHINASHHQFDYSLEISDDELYDLRIVTPAEGGFVCDEVLRLLDEESALMCWPPIDQIQNVVLVCPAMKHPVSGATLSGTYVVQAIREFLDRRDLPVNTVSEGFVVSHDTGVVRFFPWIEEVEGRPMKNEDRGFIAHTFHGNEWSRWFIDIGRMWRVRRGRRVRAASADLARRTDGDLFQLKEGENEVWVGKCKCL